MVEMLISVGVGAVFMASVMTVWYFSASTYKNENAKYLLRYQGEKVLERIKADVRLSDSNYILFYPPDTTSYTAISIPKAMPDASGLLRFNSAGIDWDSTILYYVATNNAGQREIRRAEVSGFLADADDRQEQMAAIVAGVTNDDKSNIEQWNNLYPYTYTTLVRSDSVQMKFTPTTPVFDGYAASASISGTVSFGSVRLTAGNHTVRFQVVGRNDQSSGFKMGLDTLSLTPSGGIQEAEVLSLVGDTGDSSSVEDMTGVGSWSGNHHREYRANSVGDYFELRTYYDQWLESNFYSMTHSNSTVEGNNPRLTILSREDQSLTPSWQAVAQTSADTVVSTAEDGQTLRSVISGASIQRSGQMARFKIRAGNAPLTLQEAYIGLRSGATADFASIPTQLYFDNAPLADGAVDPVGALAPGLATAVTIPAGQSVWTNWVEMPFGATTDYLLSCYVVSGEGQSWSDSTPGAVHGYRLAGNQAANLTGMAPTPSSAVLLVEQAASFQASAAAVSQVYDTKISAPVYTQLSWSPSLPPGSSARLYVRTSDDPNMIDAEDWSELPVLTVSPVSLASLDRYRYVQFRIELDAASPYRILPSVDDVTITWQGNPALVELTGQYTKRPDYGIFTVKVDGRELVHALSVDIELMEEVKGRQYTHSVSTEIRPRNTGK